MLKLFANLIAISVIGLLAYIFFSTIPSFEEYVAIASAITTGVCGLFAICVWKLSQPSQFSVSVLRFLTLSWGVAILFFVLACGLSKIPISEGIALPRALWASETSELVDWGRNRLFWGAISLGPGVTLSIIGATVRHVLLRFNRRR